ncbi:hypothetical protein QEH56_21100 [Pelagicoccus enzymogenes]|uniref:hypothetical protein n=1 Tax=Pelagicoccus enzymogenes TaxID=2773457 RepID=UPI00280EB83F|nr:hypothetical protein [Pelagicoccus enzymogenes]MDQ8200678.1 hypothetical protein [Pelagicoccus enzymogenes]
MESTIEIRDEITALNLLRDLVEDRYDEPPEIEFKGYGSIQIRYRGDRFDQTVTASVMAGLLELQRELYRTFCIARYDEPNLRRLTKEERDALELSFRIEKGSSLININFAEILQNFSKLGKKMTGKQITICALSAILAFGGYHSWKAYLSHRKEVRLAEVKSEEHAKTLEQIAEMDKNETERLKLFAELARKDERVDAIRSYGTNAQLALLKSAEAADEMEVQGLRLDGDTAHDLVKNARRQSYEKTIHAGFTVLKVDATKKNKFVVTVKSLDGDQIINAEVPDTDLNIPLKKIIRSAEWERLELKLKIKAKLIGEDITKAEIVDAKRIRSSEKVDQVATVDEVEQPESDDATEEKQF